MGKSAKLYKRPTRKEKETQAALAGVARPATGKAGPAGKKGSLLRPTFMALA